MIRRTTTLGVLGCLLFGLLAALGAGYVAHQEITASAERAIASDARIRQALLESEIARYRLLPLALADDRDVLAAAQAVGQAGQAREDAPELRALNIKLERLSKVTGASVIYLVDRNGMTIAASNWRAHNGFVGSNYGFRRYFLEALRKGSGRQFALGSLSHKPGLYLAQRTQAGGAVVVKLEFDWIETEWAQAGGITFVTNREGIVLVTSREDWRFATTRQLGKLQRERALRDSGVQTLKPVPWEAGRNGLVRLAHEKVPYLLVRTPRDGDGWSLGLAVPVGSRIESQVRLVALCVGLAAMLLAGLAAWFVLRQRHRYERTSELEEAVTSRTAQLRSEMQRRAVLEERAAELREELRLANRLATLGQVSASVAHETAQPVAAIRTYAASARLLLAQAETAEVAENLSAIDRLAEHIGIVTAQLRNFARKKGSGSGEAALAEVFEGTRLLLRDRLAGVQAVFPDPPAGIRVFGDTVRIEQILVNLLQNALEALAMVPDPRIEVALRVDTDSAQLVLTVCDNGPGIDPDVAERLFTPFTSSREEGLGLGLVIAQDIAAEFGGSLRLVEPEEGSALCGACFELTLRIVS